jgi:hypothetical protein
MKLSWGRNAFYLYHEEPTLIHDTSMQFVSPPPEYLQSQSWIVYTPSELRVQRLDRSIGIAPIGPPTAREDSLM